MKRRRMAISTYAEGRAWLKVLADLLFGAMGYSWLAKLLSALIPLDLFLIILIALLLVAWPAALVFFWQNIIAHLHSTPLLILAVLASLLVGFLLYLARVFMRPVYGLAEVIIGFIACWAGFSKAITGGASANPVGDDIIINWSANVLSTVVTVIGGVYIIIRGFDNIIDDTSLLPPQPPR